MEKQALTRTPGAWSLDDFAKASFSGKVPEECVGVAYNGGTIAVRSTKQELAPDKVLEFDRAEWVAFVKGVRAGEFDYDLFGRVRVRDALAAVGAAVAALGKAIFSRSLDKKAPLATKAAHV